MWTRVSCWFCWVVIKWLILVLMVLTSLAVAVPVSQLSASPKKGRRLLMHLLGTGIPSNEGSFLEVEWLPEGVADKRCTCCLDCWVLPQVLTIVGLVLRASIEEMIMWHVLVICPMNSFHCFSIFPSDTCAVIIQEWHVGYAFSTGWQNTDSLFSHVVLMSVIMHAMLERRWECRFYLKVTMCMSKFSSSICECNSRQVCEMVDVFPCSAKLHFNISKFNWWLKYYIFDVAWSCFSSSLIFDMKIMSIMLNMDNSISRHPLQVPLPSLFCESILCHLS